MALRDRSQTDWMRGSSDRTAFRYKREATVQQTWRGGGVGAGQDVLRKLVDTVKYQSAREHD